MKKYCIEITVTKIQERKKEKCDRGALELLRPLVPKHIGGVNALCFITCRQVFCVYFYLVFSFYAQSRRGSEQGRFMRISTANSPPPKRPAVRWLLDGVKMMLDGLVELANAGSRRTTRIRITWAFPHLLFLISVGLNVADLHALSRTLANEGHNLDAKQIKSKFDDLKKIWKEWCLHLRKVSGWGCEEEDVRTSTRGTEDAYFTAHPES